MKRLYLGIALSLFIFPFPVPVAAENDTIPIPPELIITEVKVRNDTSGYNEFIEVYNPGDEPVPLQEFQIEYLNKSMFGSEDVPAKAVIAQGILPAKSSLVLAKDTTQIADSQSSSFTSLLDSAGLIRITNITGDILDQVAWNSSQTQAISPIVHLPTTSSAKSIQRAKDENGEWVIAPVQWELKEPTPISTTLLPLSEPEDEIPEPNPVEEILPLPEEVIPENTENNTDIEVPPEEPPTMTLLPLQLSELLPNPKSPETDNNDEYVELYNPNSEAIDLSGYKIQTGSNFTYSYMFTEGTIPANGYFIVTSGGSNLALANTAGKARLVDPNGLILMETSNYEEAKEGEAWALISGNWQWTSTPTRLGANILALPIIEAKVPAVVKTITKKTPKPKLATQPKVKAASTKKAATKKAPKKAETVAVAVPDNTNTPPPLHPAVLAGVSGLAVLYAGYEYRHDMANRIYSFRSYRAARRAARAASAGR